MTGSDIVPHTCMVSVICAAYNHERYIGEALESIIGQRTSHPFEILVHDDASEDGTAAIIRSYAKRYPDRIRTIFQDENQHRKGRRGALIVRTLARGKYIAICEGDDYWTDPCKLQKQIDYLESHPECSLCVHAAERVLPDKKRVRPPIRPARGSRIFTAEETIEGGGGLFATNSMVYPAKYDGNRPDFFRIAPVGDYPLTIYLALQGTVYYIDECMSAYRVGVPGSWTERTLSSGTAVAAHFDRIAAMLDAVDKETDHRYADAIAAAKRRNAFRSTLSQGRYEALDAAEYKGYMQELGLKSRIGIFMRRYLKPSSR